MATRKYDRVTKRRRMNFFFYFGGDCNEKLFEAYLTIGSLRFSRVGCNCSLLCLWLFVLFCNVGRDKYMDWRSLFENERVN